MVSISPQLRPPQAHAVSSEITIINFLTVVLIATSKIWKFSPKMYGGRVMFYILHLWNNDETINQNLLGR